MPTPIPVLENSKVGNTELTAGSSTWNCVRQCSDYLTAAQGLELGRTFPTSASYRIVWQNERKNSLQAQEGKEPFDTQSVNTVKD